MIKSELQTLKYNDRMKMIINNTLFPIFFLLSPMACNGTKEEKAVNIPSVNMYDFVSTNFEMLVEDVSCIVLEDSSDAFLNDCWKIIRYNNLYYLYSLSDFSVCIFDTKGNFVKRIDSKGKGAVETPCDIFIEEDIDQLWIMESHNFINKYTLGGEFINQEKLPFQAVKISRIHDYFLFYDGGFNKNSPYYVKRTSKDLKPMGNFVEKIVQSDTSIPMSLFTKDKNTQTIYTSLPYNDTIYISNKDLPFLPFMCLNFNGDRLTYSDFPKNGFKDEEMHEIITKKKKIYNINSFHFVNGLLFMKLEGKDASLRAIDIASKTVYKFDSFIDDISLLSQTRIQGSIDSSLLVSLTAKSFFEIYSKHDNQTKYKEIQNLLDNTPQAEGRILLEIKLKDGL